MSKLSVSHLFDAMQSLQGMHARTVNPRRPALTLSVETLASFLETESSAKASRLTAGDLAQAIRHTFDLNHDQIVADPIHLLDLPTVPAGRRLRFDPGHKSTASTDGEGAIDGAKPRPADPASETETPCSVADSLSTALGVAQARDILLRTDWIVVVIDARSLLSAACLEQMRLLARQRRLLVVWCELSGAADSPAASQHRRLLEEILSQSGLGHLGPLSGMTGDDLVSIFQALKVMGQASLVRLRVRDGERAEGPSATRLTYAEDARGEPAHAAESTRANRAAAADLPAETTVEAIESSLVKIAAREPRVVVVDRRTDRGDGDFGAQLGKRYFASGGDRPNVWQWCAGLVAGGCRPILLVPEQEWFETASALAALPDGIELRATAVIFAGPGRTLQTYSERVGLSSEATIAVARDLRDLESLLSYSLVQEGLTMIWAPADWRQPEADLNLRFDPAEWGWLERQNRAGLAERRQMLDQRFSADLAPWIAAYEEIGQRGSYIWKWCVHGVELTTLACVRSSLRADVRDTKVLVGMLNVLIDDVADQHADGELLSVLMKLVHGDQPQLDRLTAQQRRYGEFTCQIWNEIWRRAKRYPCYDPYSALLQFDLAQLFNTVYYSHLVNSNPYILNVAEHDDHSPQGMGLLGLATIDLMCSPEFSVIDLGRLREAMWHAQWMARIGNLITTWQREVKDRDYSSGVFAHAVATNDVTVEQLLSASPAQIAAAIQRGDHEAYFLRRWKQHRVQLQRLIPHVKSVDLEVTVRGLERLLQSELVSRGEK